MYWFKIRITQIRHQTPSQGQTISNTWNLIRTETIMKNLKISDVHDSMLVELSKKYRIKKENLVEEFIQENYNSKKRK